MSDAVRHIADAVLYEGYLLWPYRRSAAKNRQRWTFGCVMPPAWVRDHPDETDFACVQCLVEAGSEPRVDVTVRFLHVVHRQVHDGDGRPVDAIVVDSTRHLTWDEATEREVSTPGEFVIDAGDTRESLGAGEIVRSWHALAGRLDTWIRPAESGRYLFGARIANTTAFAADTRDEAAAGALCSMHLILRVHDGAFVSPLDPESASCVQHRLWPVLVGDAPDRSMVLASAIVLEDYPRVAAESPGDLFDGGEVDQLLTLNILGMTDEEKAEMRATDPRVSAILDRTEAMTVDDLMRLHGTLRDVRPITETS